MLTVSHDYGNSDVTIAQDGADLVVRLRRPRSGSVGEPAFRVDDLLADGKWHRVELAVRDERATITVDGRRAVDEGLGPRPLSGWNPDYTVALGDEPRGDRGWSGRLRLARVFVPGHEVDLLDPDELVPGRGAIPSRTKPLWQAIPNEPWSRSVARLIPYALLAAALQWRWRRTLWTLTACALLAFTLYAGKIFVDARHPTLSDALLGVVGALAGCLLGGLLTRTGPGRAFRSNPGRRCSGNRTADGP